MKARASNVKYDLYNQGAYFLVRQKIHILRRKKSHITTKLYGIK